MFAAALVLPAGAAADTKYDTASLTKLLITADDMKGLGYPLDEAVNGKPSSNPINVGRYFTSTDNEVVNVNLLASEDGTAPPKDLRDSVLNGDFIKTWAGNSFTKVSNFESLGVVLGDDALATFDANLKGTDYHVSAISFVKANIVGIVFYTTTGENDPTGVGLVYGIQLAKLP
jgi:hypothetical protein